jgi:O-acetyl-ADP-ribose deacetylase (regulator of RNase III)
MVRYLKGDILRSDAEALVNTVNTMGVMGKGIALQMREAFPANYKRYVEACKSGHLQPGQVLSVWDTNLVYGRKLIINFPTKTSWRLPSQLSYIEQGLIALKTSLLELQVKSVALPPLGCGNGGLDWSVVKPLIVNSLKDLDIDIIIYEPNAEIKAILQKEETGKKAHLTNARAMLLYALFAFEGAGEYSTLFAANKIAYFLQRHGQDLRLEFSPHIYGPYSPNVQKVLYALNGVYLKGIEQGQANPFEPLILDYSKFAEVEQFVKTKLTEPESHRLQQLLQFLSAYTSELPLEVLSTVDFILQQQPGLPLEALMPEVEKWSKRKAKLFQAEHVSQAYNHLSVFQSSLT